MSGFVLTNVLGLLLALTLAVDQGVSGAKGLQGVAGDPGPAGAVGEAANQGQKGEQGQNVSEQSIKVGEW